MAHIILFLLQWHSRGYTQDKFILMHAMLYIHGNIGVRGDEQNLAAAVPVHMLENLLAANTAHGGKLAGLILSFPGSQGNGGGPDAALTVGHTWVCSGALQLGRVQGTPCQPQPPPQSVSPSQSPSCSQLSWVWVERQCFEIYLWYHTKSHLHHGSSPLTEQLWEQLHWGCGHTDNHTV